MTENRAKPLAIAIDASLWDEPMTGIGLYTRNLVQALEQLGVQVRRLGARVSGESPRGSLKSTTYFLTRLPSVLSQIKEPLFHGLCNFTLPLMRVPGKRLVLTVHDVIPDLLGSSVSVAFRWQFRLWLIRSLTIADKVICDSDRTRQDLLQRFEVSPDKVEVVYLGVDHVPTGTPDADTQERMQTLKLPPQYLLYAGALDVRKNVGCLLDAVEILYGRGQRVHLVLVGQPWFGSSPTEERIGHLQSQGIDIRHLGYQPSPIFYQVMRQATVFAFPSRYEGFGLPPLEAMYLGVPAIISSAGALPEICGDAAIQVSPDDAPAWAASIERLLSSLEERQARGAAGRGWASKFTWETTARRTAQIYRSLIDDKA